MATQELHTIPHTIRDPGWSIRIVLSRVLGFQAGFSVVVARISGFYANILFRMFGTRVAMPESCNRSRGFVVAFVGRLYASQ